MNKSKSCCAVSRLEIEPKSKKINHNIYSSSNQTVNKDDMVYIAGGNFLMGTNAADGFQADGEGPVREIRVDPFYIGIDTVTNEQFQQFVNETSYKTDAEQYGWSFVFYQFVSDKVKSTVTQQVESTPWWWVVEGAYWKQPEGPDSSIIERLHHPVVHISWNDAQEYCRWAGKRLPTEAEWEFAARGGLEQKKYPWGDELTPNGIHHCNIWQGKFPLQNDMGDGYAATAPVKSYFKNGYGLYNVSGNVWEWCSDWFTTNIKQQGGSFNPKGPITGQNRVIRGGSYLCHQSYCNRYRIAARTSNTPDSSSGHMGFRCVVDV
ncbi:formylglycine-generating enzyme family protein [Alkalihalobacillus deserti]|uniref:formylglycine-generating enzyme family protein n=1 Tax=Alkalihalobacillus deserti TaxID=2879466 RepID=UPI001D14EFA8|nr:formylglycine-generating enzyme family protein [Alkalihalobacillus deserti]